MAGTIICDRIESDASFPSSINIASPIIVSNTFAIPAGSVGAPALSPVGDTNTGIYFPAADEIGISTNGVERIRVISTGGVGIGTSSPNDLIHGAGNNAYLRLSRTTFGSESNIIVGPENGSNAIYSRGALFSDAMPLRFVIGNDEGMRIDTSGNLLVGTTTTTQGARATIRGNGVHVGSSGQTSGTTLWSGNIPTINASAFLQFDFDTAGMCGAVVGEVFLLHGNSGEVTLRQLKFNFFFGRCGGALQSSGVQVEWNNQWGTPSIARVGTTNTVRISIQNTSGVAFNYGGAYMLRLVNSGVAPAVLTSVASS